MLSFIFGCIYDYIICMYIVEQNYNYKWNSENEIVF